VATGSAVKQQVEQELKQLRSSVATLNTSLAKSKVTLRYEMDERFAAEKAAQASQDSMQLMKDQIVAYQVEVKSLMAKLAQNAAKAQKRLSKAEKKAKAEAESRQKYMEDMISLQHKLGRTQSLLDDAAMSVANVKKAEDADQQDDIDGALRTDEQLQLD